MDYQLVVVRGRSASSTLKLADGITIVGRQEDCQLRIASSQVSRRHCQIFEEGGQLMVKDLGSSNGTYVNNKKIDGQQALEPGSVLRIGPVKFRVEKAGAPAAARAPKPGDTAVAAAALGIDESPSSGGDEEFEIAFDEVPAEPAEPIAAPKTEMIPPAGKAPKPAKAEAPAKPEEVAMADDAVADFLMSIDLEDEGKK